MYRIVIAALLIITAAPAVAASGKSSVSAAPPVAASGKNSIGVSYGLDLNGVFGIQGEFDISSRVNKAPVSAQVFYKNYSESFVVPGTGTYQYSYTGIGAAAIYDFSSVSKLDKRIKPYAGLGLIILSSQLSGPAAPFSVAADKSGIYFTGGVRYSMTSEFSADLSYNNFGGLTIGANYRF